MDKYKTCLVSKGYTLKEDIDFVETFSQVILKDSFKIILTFVAFNLELHKIDVKLVFFNGNIE